MVFFFTIQFELGKINKNEKPLPASLFFIDAFFLPYSVDLLLPELEKKNTQNLFLLLNNVASLRYV